MIFSPINTLIILLINSLLKPSSLLGRSDDNQPRIKSSRYPKYSCHLIYSYYCFQSLRFSIHLEHKLSTVYSEGITFLSSNFYHLKLSTSDWGKGSLTTNCAWLVIDFILVFWLLLLDFWPTFSFLRFYILLASFHSFR